MIWLRRSSLLLILFLALMSSGCGDDDDCAVCPGDLPDPSLANLWPTVDGTDWAYDFQFQVSAGLEDTGEDLPTMEALHQALLVPVATEQISLDEGIYRQTWNGHVTTDSGITALNMDVTIYSDVNGEMRTPGGNGLLQLIAQARPDLRPGIEQHIGSRLVDKSLTEAGQMFFLSPYAFAVEDSGYFGYGDIDQNHSWVFLTDDLEVGAEFAHQLVPGLAEDIWLYGRVWSVGDFTVGETTYHQALECMYVIDLGIQEVVDEEGNILASGRSYSYGRTVFVPEVGPVFCQERRALLSSDSLQDDPLSGIYSYTCALIR